MLSNALDVTDLTDIRLSQVSDLLKSILCNRCLRINSVLSELSKLSALVVTDSADVILSTLENHVLVCGVATCDFVSSSCTISSRKCRYLSLNMIATLVIENYSFLIESVTQCSQVTMTEERMFCLMSHDALLVSAI